MNYKMILQYDGTRYNGWQKQGNTDNTIQGKLETLLSRIAGEPVEIHGAGRTDDGRKHVFERKYVYFPEAPLDVEKMKEASKAFIGTYDFRSFCANKRMKKSTVRTITGIDFCEKDGILIISYTGTGFLYHMVRILTGTLVEAGMGKRDIASMTEFLKAKNRESAGFLAPACGLLLKEVRYE